jgi:hypothetical protein
MRLPATVMAALLAVLLYAGLLLPILARHHFDPSTFIDAGSTFTDKTKLVSPIIVTPDYGGYDGQFYYRLALTPWDLHATAFGITLDKPAWRMQRIAYPVLAWAASLGRAGFVPWALVAVNLAGLVAIAVFAVRLTARLHLSPLTPWVIMLWPGFIVTLSHDTTEIAACAFLLAALDAYFADRLWLYAVLGGVATLARETSLLVLVGIFCLEIASAWRSDALLRAGRRWVVCGLALLPFVAWRELMSLLWSQSPQAGGSNDIGWPLAGALTMLRDTATGARRFAALPGVDLGIRLFTFASAAWLLVFCAAVATRTRMVLRGSSAVLAAAWLPVVGLMLLLTAQGPWIDETAYFRAFTECYVIGCLLAGVPPATSWMRRMTVPGAALGMIGAWVLAYGGR